MHGQPLSPHRYGAQEVRVLTNSVSNIADAFIEWMLYSARYLLSFAMRCDKMSQTIPSQ